jgi:ribokinase
VVFGSLNVDRIARVDHLPSPGETVRATALEVHAGGKGANQATAAGRAGARVAMYGAVGDDDGAELVLEGLRAAGVDVSGVQSRKGPTGQALIFVEPAGENVIAIVAGANAEPGRPDVEAAALLLQQEVPVDANLAALRAAGNARRILNAAPADPGAAGLLDEVDDLIVNETEAALLAGAPVSGADSALAAARNLLASHSRLFRVIVTLGAEGCVYAERGGSGAHQPAFPVRVVDTTGAGDAFCGVYAASIAEGLELRQALARAQAAGALCATRPGAGPAMPDAAEIDRLVATGAPQ